MVDKSSTSDPGLAIPFISIDPKSGLFSVTPESMEFLESLPRSLKLSIVAIAGPYRTGKSFLANRLLNQSKGFEIGSTTQACTKGIWLWNKAINISEGHAMIIIDTEGMASTERSTNIDHKIFSISILLASMFVYNQMGPITENSLEDLSLVANLTNYIHIQQQQQSQPISSKSKPQETGADFRQFFPHFIWVMRDFYHDLEGQTPKQYLEECLQPTAGLTSDILKKNLIRESITKYFKERECFTMIRPVSDESKLAHVDSLKWEELKSDFRKEVSSFVTTVKKKLKPKIINGKILNASMFLSLALEYTEAINNKETPTVLTAIDRVIQAETSKIQDEQYDQFCQMLEQQINEDSMPMTNKNIQKIIRKTTTNSKYNLQKLLANILSFPEILLESNKLIQRSQDQIKQKLQQNYSASYHYSLGILKKLFNSLDSPFSSQPTSLDPNLIHDYIRKWTSLLKEYQDLAQCSTQWEVFAEYIVKQSDNSSLFINTEMIDFEQEETASDMNTDDDDQMSHATTQYSTHHMAEQHYALSLFEQFLDGLIDCLNDHTNKLKLTIQEAASQEKKQSHQKKSLDQQIELQRQQNDDLVSAKHDFEMKIENLRREVESRRQEIDSLKQVKEVEVKNLKRNQERQSGSLEEEVKSLKNIKQNTEVLHNSLQSKVQDLDSEKRKEVSQIQTEIQKLEDDVEELKNKMKSKENNPHYIQVNQFFQEVQEYIQEYKSICQDGEQQINHKSKLFALQKQLNDIDYQANQADLKLKKQLDDQLRKRREELERDIENRILDNDQEKSSINMLTDKKQVYEQQVDSCKTIIQDSKDRQLVLVSQHDSLTRNVLLKSQKIAQMNKQIAEVIETQQQIEETIYTLSIENKQKQEDKEIMLMLLPQIYKFLMGRSNNIKGFVNQMESDVIRSKVQRLLQSYKIQFK